MRPNLFWLVWLGADTPGRYVSRSWHIWLACRASMASYSVFGVLGVPCKTQKPPPQMMVMMARLLPRNMDTKMPVLPNGMFLRVGLRRYDRRPL